MLTGHNFNYWSSMLGNFLFPEYPVHQLSVAGFLGTSLLYRKYCFDSVHHGHDPANPWYARIDVH